MARELKVPAERIAQDERLYLADPGHIVEVIRELGGRRGDIQRYFVESLVSRLPNCVQKR